MLRFNERHVLADLVPNGSVGMLAGIQHGDTGAACATLGTLGWVSQRLCWEGSSFQSKLRLGWRWCDPVNVEVLALCAHRELQCTFGLVYFKGKNSTFLPQEDQIPAPLRAGAFPPGVGTPSAAGSQW